MSTKEIKDMLGSIPTTIVIQIGVGLFAAGGIWAQFNTMGADVSNLHEQYEEVEKNKASVSDINTLTRRLDKKIQDLRDLENRVRDLEKCNH